MPDTQSPRIFLSYSRADGNYAATQRDLIEAQSLSLWQDISQMEAGGWWKQIETILEASTTEHMVLMVSGHTLASEVVRREWRKAREEGVTVHPIIVPGKLGKDDFEKMPGWMSAEHFYNLNEPEQFARLIAALKGPSKQVRVPMMAPAPNPDFILRKEEGEALLGHLLAGENAAARERGATTGATGKGTIGISAALRGAGGYGKTALAEWLCHQEAVQNAYYNGILWVELGEAPNMAGKLENVIILLTGKPSGLTELPPLKTRLKEIIGERHMLLVIDDAWRKSDVEALAFDTPNLTRLITTRFNDILLTGTQKVRVDAMKPAEAVALLTVGLGLSDIEIANNHAALKRLAARLGEWALLLRLANRKLRAETDPEAGGAPLSEAITTLEAFYDEIGLEAFAAEDESSRNAAAALSIGASLKSLDTDRGEVARFEELAIFAEDEHIPVATIARLWGKTGARLGGKTGGLSETETKFLLGRIDKWALFNRYDRRLGFVLLHDVIRKYLRDRAEDPGLEATNGLKATNAAWLAAYEGVDAAKIEGPEQLYYYRRLPQHLYDAGERARLNALLLDPAWIQQKLAALATPQPLIEDYRDFAREQDEQDESGKRTPQALVGRALSQSAGSLARSERLLVPHLLGRLWADMGPEIDILRQKSHRLIEPPALAPRFPSLIPADSPLICTLEGHTGPVNAVAFSPDGTRIVSGAGGLGGDKTLRLWDAATGASRVLKGHTDPVMAVAFSPDGAQIVSGSYDRTLRLWDAATGESRVLKGHTSRVMAVAFSPDGAQIVSGSNDKTLRLWDAATGESRVLEGHTDWVMAVAFSPDGTQIVSGSGGSGGDKTLRLWDAATGESRVLKGHTDPVMAVAFSPDGAQIVSGSNDKTLRLWDAATGESRVLKGHTSRVMAVAFSPDGAQIVSGSGGSGGDKTLRLWDAATGASRVLEGHTSWVMAVAFSPDGAQIVSGSGGLGGDNTLRLWDAATGESRVLEGHTDPVMAVAFSPDGAQIVSGSNDKTLRLWDAATGESRVLKGHTSRVMAVAFSPDGAQIVSGSGGSGGDKTLRLWDAATGASRVLEGHTSWVMAVAFSPDGAQIVSGSGGLGGDNTLRLWDAATGESRVLEGHTDPVMAVAFSPDGAQIVSGSYDRTLRLWDAATGEPITFFHSDAPFWSVALSPDGRTLAAGDEGGTVHIFDILLTEADKARWLKRFEPGAPAPAPRSPITEQTPNPQKRGWLARLLGKS